MPQYILLNDDRTEIINNIQMSSENDVQLVVKIPENLIEVKPNHYWNGTEMVEFSESEKTDQKHRTEIVSAAIKSYETAKKAVIDAAVNDFNQKYQPPSEN